MPCKSCEDPRVVVADRRYRAVPQWRLLKLWREAGRLVAVQNAVIAEQIAEEKRRGEWRPSPPPRTDMRAVALLEQSVGLDGTKHGLL